MRQLNRLLIGMCSKALCMRIHSFDGNARPGTKLPDRPVEKKGAAAYASIMLTFKALSLAFRELQAPELEAARKELAEVKARLAEVEDELRFDRKVIAIQTNVQDRFRRRNTELERENKRLREDVEGRQQVVLEHISEIVKLRDRLSKRRKTQDASA